MTLHKIPNLTQKIKEVNKELNHLKENTGGMLHDNGFDNNFLDMIQITGNNNNKNKNYGPHLN